MSYPSARVTWGRLVAMAAAATLTGCGSLPDLRRETMRGITNLGTIRPFYPFDETHRIGGIYIQDVSVEEARLRPEQVVQIRLSEALVPSFQEMQQQRRALTRRNTRSDEKIRDGVPNHDDLGFIRQPAPAAGDAPTLAVAAFPGYSLGTVTQVSGSAFMPSAAATFLAGIGLRNTSSLELEAIGVEAADLPWEDALRAIGRACVAPPGNLLANGGSGGEARALVQIAHYQLETWRRERGNGVSGWGAPAPVQAQMFIPWRIYYLRGIRFIVKDTAAVSAVAQVARSYTPRAGSATPPAVQSVQVTTAPAGGAADTAGLAALQQQVEQLRMGLAGAQGGPQFAASVARATARGVELVQMFDRPLAFGHQSFWVPVAYQADPTTGAFAVDAGGERRTNGLEPICRIVARDPASMARARQASGG